MLWRCGYSAAAPSGGTASKTKMLRGLPTLPAETEMSISRGRLRWAILAATAAGSTAVWWITFTRIMWLPTFYDTPHLDVPKLLGVSTTSMVSFSLVVVAESLLYLLAVWAVRPMRTARSAAVVLLLVISIAVPLVLCYPGGAGDVYAYIAEADSVVRYHLNPFYVPVSAIPGHPLLPFLDYPNETTHYGPLWLLIGVAVRYLSGPDLLVNLLAFKAAAVLFLLAVAWLVYLTLRRTRPDAAVPGALLVAWNPLLLFELSQNAHNDVAMMVFVALAFFLQSRASRRGAIAALLAASLVKYVAAVLVPFFLLVDLRGAGPWRKWVPGVVTDALAALAFGSALTIFLGFGGTFGILQKLSEWFTTSPSAVAYYWLLQWMPLQETASFLSNAGKAIFLTVYLAIVRRLWREPSTLVGSSVWIILALMVVATSWFQPWYLTWAIPLAALLATPLSYAVLVGMTLGGFLIHLIMGFAWRLDWNHGSLILINLAGALGMWLPVAVAAIGAAIFLRATSETRPIPGGRLDTPEITSPSVASEDLSD